MAVTNVYGVPVHRWSWIPSNAGSALVLVPVFLVAIEVTAWRSPWVLGAIAAGLGSAAVARVLDRESSRQTKVVRAHLGMRWGETMQDWRTHRTDALCWTLSLVVLWPVHTSGGPWWVLVVIAANNGRLALSDGLSAVQGWRREREGRAAPECPDLVPVPLTTEASGS
ncbi:hypothetical protein [Nocardioides zeae]|uniref:Uncharacterized protein n=1 Tax=Nocardioides zeae TaxID=1457234 RepID=A0A6P0HLP1_9ACTN|nr:hypothetical protein [Nocardioides zeae]NEN79533.1 hypothetical protein [Nocardioides zeae]